MSIEAETPRAEWRELGPDEVIQEGDEVESYPDDTYVTAGHVYIGKPVSSSSRRFRTRRPLPEVASTNADNSSMTTITDTPQTDVCPYCKDTLFQLQRKIEVLDRCHLSSQKYTVMLSNALSESQSEVGFWKAKVYEAEKSEGKHEVEVERLKEHLNRAIEIADELFAGSCGEWGCLDKRDNEYKKELEAFNEDVK
jgi:hypothetical protein